MNICFHNSEKYGLHLVLANQHASQLEGQLEAVKQNTALKIVGGDDPDNMSNVFKTPDGERLKDFEFFSKVRGRDVVKFKSPSVLVNNKEKTINSRTRRKLWIPICLKITTR